MTTREPHLTVLVQDWPAFGKSMSMSLTPRLYPSQDSIRAWARQRFGPGTLIRVDDESGTDQQWEYQREIPGPRGVWRLLTLLLNGSYS